MTRATRGFTLVEFMVVVVIIFIIMAILFPVIARARGKAEMTSCTQNLKQISTALQLYRSDFDGRMPFMVFKAGDGTFYRWIHVTYPYSRAPELYSCPSCDVEPGDLHAYPAEKTPREPVDTSYLYNQPHLEGIRETSVTDPGGTIMVMDGWWFSSRDAERGGFNARDYNAPMFSIEKATAEMMASWVSGEVPPNSMYVNETILKRLRRHPGRTVIAAYFDGHVAPISDAKPEDFTPYRE